MPKFYVMSASFMPRSPSYIVNEAKKAGFDGVEFLLGPQRRQRRYRRLAKKAGLTARYHEAWSAEDTPHEWYNQVAARLGIIPKLRGYLAAQLDAPLDTVVCYPHRFAEVKRLIDRGLYQTEHFAFQTCPRSQPHDPGYDQFVRTVKERNLAVAFDVFHVLELFYDQNFNGLRQIGADALKDTLRRTWDDLREHVTEIHFSDLDLSRRAGVGTNLIAGYGDLDLGSFSWYVRQSGWGHDARHVVTAEPSPHWMYEVGIPGTPLGIPVFPRTRTVLEVLRSHFG